MTTMERVKRHKYMLLMNATNEAMAEIQRRGKSWDSRARSDKLCNVRYSGALRQEESAELEAIRAELCPDYSRYAFVRLLLLQFIEAGKRHIEERETKP